MRTLTELQIHDLHHTRVQFKHHLGVYLIVNFLFWMTWYFTGSGYMWPLWPMALWGVGLILHYFVAWGE
jgi:hypothetical protein